LIVIAGFAGLRAARFIRGVPLLLPVVLIVLFAPLLTGDFWRLASDLGVRNLVFVAALTIGPFLVVLTPQLRRSSRGAFVRAAGTATASDEAASAASRQLAKVARDRDPDLPDHESVTSMLEPYFTREAMNYEAPKIEDSIEKSVKRRVVVSLVPLTVGLGSCVTVYIYLVAWALIPMRTVEGWLHKSIAHGALPVVGDLPAGPYLPGSVLLGILATAIFFAFVVTDEEKYASTLVDMVIQRPLGRAALFAVPYAAMQEGVLRQSAESIGTS
jgi:hypothetical protein